MSEERERYIILDVDYNHRIDYGRSLKWLAPDLEGQPGLTMTEDYRESDEGQVFCHRCKRWLHWLDYEDQKEEGVGCIDGDGHDAVTLHRKWSGTISESVYQKLVSAWDLDPEDSESNLGMLTEYGHLAGLRFGFDGMDWNAGGETPIDYVSLSVSAYANEEVPA